MKNLSISIGLQTQVTSRKPPASSGAARPMPSHRLLELLPSDKRASWRRPAAAPIRDTPPWPWELSPLSLGPSLSLPSPPGEDSAAPWRLATWSKP